MSGFPWTLQKYIFRETGKTFLLTAIALTGILGLGGGVREMIQLGDVTPTQLIRLLAFVLPVAAALTLPIAALFSATVTYGRLSSDNEFVACRASGINLHLLFLPALMIAFLSSIVTFLFINFLIPGMVRKLDEFVTGDLGVFVRQKLSSPRGIPLGGRFRVHADSAETVGDNQIFLHKIAFVEADGEEWIRYGTAEQVALQFQRESQRIQAQGVMSGLSFYDRRGGRFTDLERQSIPPTEIPLFLAPQIKFLTLAQLLHFSRNPSLWNEVTEAFQKLRFQFLRRTTYQTIAQDLRTGASIVLGANGSELTLRAKSAAVLPRDAGVELSHADLVEVRGDRKAEFTAARVVLEVTRSSDPNSGEIRLESYELRPRQPSSGAVRAKHVFGPFALPEPIANYVGSLSDDHLLTQPTADGKDDPLRERQLAAIRTQESTVRKLSATLHERFAFSLSVLVLVILGAALGIIFRGAHVLTAFGISFAPSLLVIIAIVAGRQLAFNAPTHVLGLSMIWTGILMVALLNAWTLLRVLRR